MENNKFKDCQANAAILPILLISFVAIAAFVVVWYFIILVSYLHGRLQELYYSGVDYYTANQDYFLSIDFLVHILAFVGFLYFSSKVYVPVYKLLQSTLEIIFVFPIIVLGWAFVALECTLLFVQKALVRPWNPNFENGAPTIDNPLGK
tara:strand:+ start:11577 stop:12023 length:447 start_codon:yes stop_codon:yes gene_type:complete